MAKTKTDKHANRVIVRTHSAGVHYGTLVRRDGREVVLSDARRIYRWRGANTLHELSKRGLDHSYSRVSEPVREIVLTEAIEVIPCEEAAIDKIDSAGWSAS
jgi:hypothetical protein